MTPEDHIGKAEIRKDALQDTVEAAAVAVGTVTTIVTTAVRDVARTVGGFATDMFEIRAAARAAEEDTRRETEDMEPSGQLPAE
ncbi:MAG TPA: hypothetical protein VFR87_11845 [Nocardioidaceae bacterium]|nr:hypothetical protein [Nocardioidaceae bacterium]